MGGFPKVNFHIFVFPCPEKSFSLLAGGLEFQFCIFTHSIACWAGFAGNMNSNLDFDKWRKDRLVQEEPVSEINDLERQTCVENLA